MPLVGWRGACAVNQALEPGTTTIEQPPFPTSQPTDLFTDMRGGLYGPADYASGVEIDSADLNRSFSLPILSQRIHTVTIPGNALQFRFFRLYRA